MITLSYTNESNNASFPSTMAASHSFNATSGSDTKSVASTTSKASKASNYSVRSFMSKARRMAPHGPC